MAATLLLRADAGPEVGAGHAARCFALAEAWMESGGQAVVALAPRLTALERWAAEAGCRLEPVSADAGSGADAATLLALAEHHAAAWVAVDGYRFAADYHERLAASGAQVLWIDDCAPLPRYVSALVLNQNAYAAPGMYPRIAPGTRLLLGPRYALLRGAVRRRLGLRRRIAPRARRVLITAGAADPAGLIPRALAALARIENAGEYEVVVASGVHVEATVAAAARSSLGRLEVLGGFAEPAGWMAWADLALCAAGTTALECCALGLPALLVAVADNQRAVAAPLAAVGAAVDLGWHEGLGEAALGREIVALAADPARRRSLSRRGRRLVDGAGAERVVMALLNRRLRLRTAGPGDRRRTWEWANDVTVRAASFSTAPIGWREHCAWFEARLADPAAHLFIAVDRDDRPVGIVRFAVGGASAVVSIAVDAEHRGRGFGPEMLSLGCERLFAARSGVERVEAWIREGNVHSLRAFRRAGFVPAGGGAVSGVPARRLVLEHARR